MADIRYGATPVTGDVPHDSADAGYPIKTGAKASAAPPTAVTDGDRVNDYDDLQGRKITAHKCGTATTSQIADNASSTTLLSANNARLGASIHNDSSAVLYVKLGTTASATDYTVRMVQYAYYEVPYGYVGRIDGIWASDPGDGAARITEYT